MLRNLKLENILFLDIETVPEVEHFGQLDDAKRELWDAKSKYQRKDDYTAEEFYERAGIWAEFGRIICISVGFFAFKTNERTFRVKSFRGEERELLADFKNLLTIHFNEDWHLLCAHNGKEFDYPYIARRMIINNIELPNKFILFGKKPWEVPHLDTLELWKFGDYKTFCSLKLLTHVLGISSPKEDIDGSDVYRVYYSDKDHDRIVDYCERDTVAVAQIFLRLRGDNLLREDEIVQIK